MSIFAILIPVNLNLKFSLQDLAANLTWEWASHQDSSSARETPSSSTTASIPPTLCSHVSFICQPRLCPAPQRHEPGTAASTGKISSNFFLLLVLDGTKRLYLSITLPHVSKISVLPLTWLKAGLFQKPKQRKLREFPLILAYAALIHFLHAFCQ